VLARIDLRGKTPATLTAGELTAVLPRAALDVTAALEAVRPICDDVRLRGGEAVREFTAKFDGVDLPGTRVPADALATALRELSPQLRAALSEAARRARLVHKTQLPTDAWTAVDTGSTVTERYIPVRRAGVYVPGGLVAYPSSVLMNVIPAQVAGVSEIAVASPPQAEFGGLPHPAILAACAMLGVSEVHAAGGAQAIAMLGYGTQECAPVDVITGPGNVYVAAAKRLLSERVAIDAEAGPTEIAIIADDGADASFVAADLIAQAEHDPLAACLLISTSAALADRVEAELARTVPQARHADRVTAALAGQSACVLVDDADSALAVSDAWAPEHLEIQAADAAILARRVRNAGAIFVGAWAPVSLGDYLAGSNHVLPTGGTARFTGGLSVFSFLRCVHLVECDERALAAVAPHIDALGGAEDLAAHVQAVRVRVPAAPGETASSGSPDDAEATPEDGS
jgi:histidinol dehydrogenase